MVIVSKWHSKSFHGSNTIPTPSQTIVALRYTILYYRDPLAADDGSKKKIAQTLNANQVKIMRLMTLPTRGRVMRNK